ncbi:MAG: hypothetical protein ACRDQ5_20780 [Sciscionella sp.]
MELAHAVTVSTGAASGLGCGDLQCRARDKLVAAMTSESDLRAMTDAVLAEFGR